MDEDKADNYVNFRDCFSELAISTLSSAAQRKRHRVKGRKNEIKPVIRPAEEEHAGGAEDLAEFIDYMATEMFESMPFEAQTLTYRGTQDDAVLKEKYDVPLETSTLEGMTCVLPPSVVESLTTYGVLKDASDLNRVLEPVLTAYIKACTATPPENDSLTKATECEMCEREHIPLTYHHLIPKQIHAKALKRGWAKDWELQKVAWLCRACHSFVHRTATNEEWRGIIRVWKN